jgi:Flp pilus assembly protein TadG
MFRMTASTKTPKTLKKLRNKLASMRSDERGVAAIEFSFFAALLCFGLLNTADIGIYIYKRMELENAAQTAAEWVLNNCSPNNLPATTQCANLTSNITNAMQSTSLGNQITLASGSPAEGYYCVNSSNALQYVSSVSNPPPADCTAAGMPSLQPADYIQITAQYAYAPLFPGITVASAFTTPITKTSLIRLD